MPTQTVQIDLPEEVFRRLEGMAALTRRPLADVISQTIQGNLPPMFDDVPAEQRDLVAELQGLSDEALRAIARESLPVTHRRRQQRLLRQGEMRTLDSAEQTALADLREGTDRLVLRRSYALALLKWRGSLVSIAP